ncbi:MAG: FAD-dependent oxidoreductase, partial [Alphaproteobacteria bacterium]|nr:FAD-dependent oxidoreductase [Alphaproteobacteria bacterium]
MSSGRVYVIGAGLAGLSAAVHLAELGATITLIEGANQAGGRCRSYFDAALDQVIDNGN